MTDKTPSRSDEKKASVSTPDKDDVIEVEKSAAVKSMRADSAVAAVNPYPNYDMLSLEQLRALAEERDVHINADVEKAHLVTELRAADSRGL